MYTRRLNMDRASSILLPTRSALYKLERLLLQEIQRFDSAVVHKRYTKQMRFRQLRHVALIADRRFKMVNPAGPSYLLSRLTM
jgi:hypothetical protein